MLFAPWLAVRWSLKQFRTQKWWERQQEAYTAVLINVAMPKLTQMCEAMHIRKRALALKHGAEALGLLPVE